MVHSSHASRASRYVTSRHLLFVGPLPLLRAEDEVYRSQTSDLSNNDNDYNNNYNNHSNHKNNDNDNNYNSNVNNNNNDNKKRLDH